VVVGVVNEYIPPAPVLQPPSVNPFDPNEASLPSAAKASLNASTELPLPSACRSPFSKSHIPLGSVRFTGSPLA